MGLLNIINKIRESLTGILSNKSSFFPIKDSDKVWRENSGYNKRVFRIERGRSFRGHAMELNVYNNPDGKCISLFNHYLSGSVGCSYDIDNNITRIDYRCSSPTPKYIQYVLRELQIKSGVISELNVTISNKFKIGGDSAVEVNINEYNMDFIMNSKNKGLTFNNHFDNINKLKEVIEFRKRIKKMFKQVDIISNLELTDHKNQWNPNYKVWKLKKI